MSCIFTFQTDMRLVPSVCPSMTNLESTHGGESLLNMKAEIRLLSSVWSMSCLFTFQTDLRLLPNVCPSFIVLESTHGGESLLNMKALLSSVWSMSCLFTFQTDMGLVPSVCPSMTDLESTDGGESLLTMRAEIWLLSSVWTMSCLFTFQTDMRLFLSVPFHDTFWILQCSESLLTMKADIRLTRKTPARCPENLKMSIVKAIQSNKKFNYSIDSCIISSIYNFSKAH